MQTSRIQAVRPDDPAQDDGRFLGNTILHIWENLATSLGGTLLLGLAILPAFLFSVASENILLAALAVLLLVVPAWTGFCYMTGRGVLQYPPRLSDMLAAAVHYYWRSLGLGLPVVLVAVILLITVPWLTGPPAPPVPVVAGILLQLATLVVLCLLSVFSFPLLALYDLSLRQTWTYSLLLAVRWPIAGIGLLALWVLQILLGLWVSPTMWLFLPMVFGPFAVNASLILARRAVRERQ